jgi:hypothetical protein
MKPHKDSALALILNQDPMALQGLPEDSPEVVVMKKKRVLQALYHTMGRVSTALRLVGVTLREHNEWKRKDPEYQGSVEAIQDGVTDFVEGKMFERINGVFHTNEGELEEYQMHELENWPEGLDPDSPEGQERMQGIRIRMDSLKLRVYKVPPSDTLIQFYLRTKGRDRGYAERTEITGANGSAFLASKTDAELAALISSVNKKLE